MSTPSWEEEIARLREIVDTIRSSGRVANDPASVEELVTRARGERIDVTQRHIDALVSLGVLRPVRRRRGAGLMSALSRLRRWRAPIAVAATLIVLIGVAYVVVSGRESRREIAGHAFVDYDGNGVRDVPEVAGGRRDQPVAGVTVSVFDRDEREVGTATTGADGSYALQLSKGGPYRVEFSEIPEDLFPYGEVGPTVGDIQFRASGGVADLALLRPADFCQEGPPLATTCFLSGDHRATVGPGAPGLRDAIVSFPWEATDFGETFPPEDWPEATLVPAARWTQNTGPEPSHLATIAEVGAVWGLAYDRSGNRLFASAMLKRHADLGDLGTGGIYVVEQALDQEVEGRGWLDVASLSYPVDMAGPLAGRPVQTGPDPRDGSPGNGPLPASVGEPSVDIAAFSAVGTRAFGDIDVSADGSQLWVVNLFDRTLLRVDTESAQLSGAWPVPDPGCADPDDVRPWGLSVGRGDVYLGVVCSAQLSGEADDLSAHVLKWDGDEGFEQVLEVPLGYSRRAPASPPGEGRTAPWAPWVKGTDPADDPQPILSDISFDASGMTLAFMDRQGHQWGHANFPPVIGASNPDQSRAAAGELLRACLVAGEWALEENARCDGAGAGPQDVGTGPGGDVSAPEGSGEFFFGEGFRSPFVDHEETALGSVATLAGADVVASTILDPVALFSSGAAWFDRETGDHSHRYEVLVTEDPDAPQQNGTFGKASGLGDLEVLCRPAPLVLGGRLWRDDNGDGLHGAAEPPLGVGVEVVLAGSDGSEVARTSVDDAGYYEFRWAYGGPLAEPAPEGLEILIETSSAEFAGLQPSDLPETAPDRRRSRGVPNGEVVSIKVPADRLRSGRGDMNLSVGWQMSEA